MTVIATGGLAIVFFQQTSGDRPSRSRSHHPRPDADPRPQRSEDDRLMAAHPDERRAGFPAAGRRGRDRHEFQRLWLRAARRPAMDHRRLRRAVRARRATRRASISSCPTSASSPSGARMSWASSPPMRMKITSAPSRRLWPSCDCPVYATPFTARLIEGKLDEAGLQRSRAGRTMVPLRRQAEARARSTSNFISITHSIPEPNAARHPHAAGRGRAYRRLEDSIPIRCLGEATDADALAQTGRRRACWRWSAIPPMRWCRAHPARKRACAKRSIDLIGTLKGRVAVTAFASNVARLDTHRARGEGPWPRDRAGRPRHAQDRPGGARNRLSRRTFRRCWTRTKPRDLPPRTRALPVHRQPGRAARGAGAHRRGRVIRM